MDDTREMMRNRFYGMFQIIKYKEAFYNVHYRKAHLYNVLFSTITLFVSVASALIWSISSSLPILWALVIAAAQMVQAMKDITPWSRRLSALEHFQPDLRMLLLDIENAWDNLDIEVWNTEKIRSMRGAFDLRYFELEQKYIGNTYFPRSDRICAEAQEETDTFFRNRYETYTEKGDEANVPVQ